MSMRGKPKGKIALKGEDGAGGGGGTYSGRARGKADCLRLENCLTGKLNVSRERNSKDKEVL